MPESVKAAPGGTGTVRAIDRLERLLRADFSGTGDLGFTLDLPDKSDGSGKSYSERVRLTEEEAALIYLYRCLDERGKGGAMNYITFTYSRMTRNAILQNRSNAAE